MSKAIWYAPLVLLAGSSYGFASPVLKLAYRHGFHVQDVANAQYGFGAVLIWIVVLFWHSKPKIRGRQWILLSILGVLGAGTSLTYYESLRFVPASLGIVLLFQFSWMVLLMDVVVTRHWPSVEKWIGLALILAGTWFAVGITHTHLHHVPAWAILSGLASALLYGLTLYLSGYTDSESSPTMRSAIVITLSALTMMVFFRPTYLVSGVIGHGLWLWGLLMALVAQVVPMILLLIAIPKTGGRMAGTLGSIELPVAVISSHFMLGESLTVAQWSGVIFILLGIVLSEFTFKPQRTTVAA